MKPDIENKSLNDLSSQNEQRRIRLSNSISIISGFSLAGFIVYYSLIDFELMLQRNLMLAIFTILSLTPVLLNRLKLHHLAKFYVASFDTLIMLLLILKKGGTENGSHILFLLFAIIPIYIWSVKEKYLIILFYLLNLFLFVFFHFFEFSTKPDNTLPDEFNAITIGFTILISYIGATISIIIFHRLAEKKEYQLQQTNFQIEQQKTELLQLNQQLAQQLEELRLQQNEINNSNLIKGKIYSVIAHDLRSPITSMNALLKLMMNDTSDIPKDQLESYISSLFSTSQNTSVLLENLLEWSRAQTGHLKVCPEYLNLYSMVEEAFQFNEFLRDKKQIELYNTLHKEIQVFADKHLLSIVLRNLISNALKFTPRKGKVSIHCTDKNNNEIELSITDTGTGMTGEEISRLFRVEKGLLKLGTEKEKGTGLGLVICKEFIEKNNGVIHIKSIPGKGSTMSFTLPVKGNL
ncbi:MAG: HAMP domain-containing histidine kinase [Bacteroidota bacterium]|nr:MAG: HAMP domain-containing histidine kinase [Bacteroidota bacterium]